MSTDVSNELAIPQPTEDEILAQQSFGMPSEDFRRLPAQQRDVILFVMLQHINTNFEFLTNKVTDYEAKAARAFSPEGRTEMFDALSKEFPMIGMLKGMM